MKIIQRCINLSKKTTLEIEDRKDIKNIYNYIISKINYINPKDPNIIKFIISIPTIEILMNRELRHIIDDDWITYLKNIKKIFLNAHKLREYKKLKKYQKDIIMSFIYDTPEIFCTQVVNRIKMKNPFDGYISIIRILWENNFIIIPKYAKDLIKKIRSSTD